jgi:hypothetical protein
VKHAELGTLPKPQTLSDKLQKIVGHIYLDIHRRFVDSMTTTEKEREYDVFANALMAYVHMIPPVDDPTVKAQLEALPQLTKQAATIEDKYYPTHTTEYVLSAIKEVAKEVNDKPEDDHRQAIMTICLTLSEQLGSLIKHYDESSIYKGGYYSNGDPIDARLARSLGDGYNRDNSMPVTLRSEKIESYDADRECTSDWFENKQRETRKLLHDDLVLQFGEENIQTLQIYGDGYVGDIWFEYVRHTGEPLEEWKTNTKLLLYNKVQSVMHDHIAVIGYEADPEGNCIEHVKWMPGHA